MSVYPPFKKFTLYDDEMKTTATDFTQMLKDEVYDNEAYNALVRMQIILTDLPRDSKKLHEVVDKIREECKKACKTKETAQQYYNEVREKYNKLFLKKTIQTAG